MSVLPMRGLRQLATGRPAAPSFSPSLPPSLLAVRAVSTATYQASHYPQPKKTKKARIPPPPPKSPSAAPPTTVPYKRYRQPRPELAKFPEKHGEQIWVFDNIMTNQVVYAHTPVFRANRALRQLPFNGKKTKPAKMRKDYWRPMALVQFGAGEGAVGRSVFHKLREFRRLHELSWGYQADELRAMDRKARGDALCDQRANAIADLAAVLGGAGAGSRVKTTTETAAADAGGRTTRTTTVAKAVVYWANEQDRNFAQKWTWNVQHAAGIPSLHAPRGTDAVGEVVDEAVAA